MSHQKPNEHVDVDSHRNTLFHKYAVDLQGIEELDRLAECGIDPNQANSAGRTPLHALCSVGWYDDYLDEGLVAHVQWFLRHTTNVDAPDTRGVRALHIASMMSEYLVKALLAAGADPAGATSEGLTPLHLAARARQSNIVGILLDALRARTSTTPDDLSRLNARDEIGRSPLHYACRSGRHETVALLLTACADVHAQDDAGLNILDACAEFDEEQRLWADYRKPDKGDWETLALTSIGRDWNRVAVAGIGIDDMLRPWVKPGKLINHVFLKTFGQAAEDTMNNAKGGIRSCQDTTRLQEILRMLRQSWAVGSESSASFNQNLDRCVQRLSAKDGNEYTLRCFSDLAVELSNLETTHDQRDAEVLESLSIPAVKLDDAEFYVNETLVNQLLRRRDYDVIERLLRRVSPLCPKPKRILETRKILHLLVKQGFAHLAGVIFDCNEDILDDLLLKDRHGEKVEPPLVLACQRELPNMDVVRLLVDRAHVDLNARSMTMAERESTLVDRGWTDDEDEPDPGQSTALHELGIGRHWWVVKQAIPYLLSKGADRDVLNEAGQTPLRVAEEYLPRGIFRGEAIEGLSH